MKKLSALILILAIANVMLTAIAGFGVRMDWWGYPIGFSILKIAFGSGVVLGGAALIVLTIMFVKNLTIIMASE